MKKGRVVLNIALIALLVLFVGACGNKGKKATTETEADEKLGKVETEIPEAIKGNPEAVAYFESLNEVVDQYAVMIDKWAEEMEKMKGKKPEDLSESEQMKMMTMMSEISMKATPIFTKWAELEEKRNTLEDGLSEAEVEAFASVYDRLTKRMEQVQEKYAELLGDEDDTEE